MDQPRAAGRGRGGRGRKRRDEPEKRYNAWGVPLQTQRTALPASSRAARNGDADSQPSAPVVSRKFEEACAKIQANVEKFLPQTQDDRSSSEEELETEGILSRVVGSYSELNDVGSGDLQRTVQFLTDNLVSGAVVCLICIESIKRTEKVNASLVHEKAGSRAYAGRQMQTGLVLIHCGSVKKYVKMKCHCGLNPVYVPCHQWTVESRDQQDELQSCKNRCCKQLGCGHRCPLNCHPGTCAPRSQCRKKVTLRCPCKFRKVEGPCCELESSLDCSSECRSEYRKET
ncbi:hypothetical protein HPB49_010516 [Dermacentor silvarum]|uniref:Uncharacterized protein n=1 Tax=Dermacentor silvarum TaxID=543639 RepID=A0ACB8CWQ0_DERSI|nr:hypothetical protein HPB49_010516 [Dermacentor silvarum]